jgi:hypothetical protein
MEFSLTASVVAVLEKNGWFKGRDVDIDRTKAKLLTGLAITTSTAANRFLKEFSGLRISLEHERIEFDIDYVIGCFVKEEAPYLHTIVERHLCPVGYCRSGLIFLIADDYSVVLLSDQWMCYFHYKSLNDALFSLFNPGCNLAKQIEVQEHQFPPEERCSRDFGR